MAINTELVRVALDRVDGSTFERFINQFYPSVVGADFFPLGGVKDGGADAFGGDRVYEKGGSAEIFYQATVQEDFRAKIRHTVARLKEFGRNPRSLYYLTSRSIRHIDREEDTLGEELGVTIRIRDASYIVNHINSDKNTRNAFEEHLRHLTDFLRHVGSSTLITPTANVRSPAVYVFLRQELDRRGGNESLVNSVIDSLVLWALEGTDPEQDKFMTAEEVEQKILSEIPAAKALVAGRAQGRLESLATKGRPGGRKVTWYRRDRKFCLPFHSRELIEQQNLKDEALRLQVLNDFYARASKNYPDMPEKSLRAIAHITLRAFQLVFEREGLEFSHFISQEAPAEYPTMSDAVRDALAEARVSGARSIELGVACLATVRGCFYDSTPEERSYLGKLARTYTLLFTLNTEPKLVQYFQDMAADFHLLVGSDLLVRALSERYLPEPDRLTRNALILAARAGAKLILTQPVLEEVVGHLRASDFEYKNHIQPIEHRITPEMAAAAPKILNRTYLYAKLDPLLSTTAPDSWRSFVEQFCDYGALHRPEALDEIRRYLQFTFSMSYQSTDDLKKVVEAATVDELTERLLVTKPDLRLAQNDALLACSVYGRREQNGETSQLTEFGYNTWWLTRETAILRHTRELVAANHGARYIMRPDFLLNFLAFAPSVDQARQTFGNVFPSSLGIQLSRNMGEAAFRQIMAGVRAAEALDDGRRNAAMARYADQLKSDFARKYLFELP
ncbi:hypothetical protein Q3W71_13610 [Micromonospora sp. C28SCA-DRY-2]|uniref:hypothetical protein n=1 Tax=Micromonospora sp. C28SCA-DRY-2 TaxID=3059522 RepID=UPI0026761E9E|nr:hypothetical protein [Micromonospora sp. C28SCA-DRY-2]MDO3702705.1 hypothetical protein [Micromonospora sp. C28SCA-DRY-2]